MKDCIVLEEKRNAHLRTQPANSVIPKLPEVHSLRSTENGGADRRK